MVAERLEVDPDPVRVVLVAAVVVVLVGLVLDAAPGRRPGWRLERGATSPTSSRRDPRTAANLRILESHLAIAQARLGAARPARGPRRAGAAVAPRRAPATTARACQLLGPELTASLTEPPRKLRREEIDRCVRGSRSYELPDGASG